MIVTYEEIPANAAGTNRDDLAGKMVDLIERTSLYARSLDPDFKIVPQNSPDCAAWPKYLPAMDGLGVEELYYKATDNPCSQNLVHYQPQQHRSHPHSREACVDDRLRQPGD